MVEAGKRGYSAMTNAAAAESCVANVRDPPPRKRKPIAMLSAMWLP